jgi:alpha-beta hydrolase superfamily lysophospholipase
LAPTWRRPAFARRLAAVFLLLYTVATSAAYCEIFNTTSTAASSTEDALSASANENFWKRNFAASRIALEKLADMSLPRERQARILVNLAICNAQLENWEEAQHQARQGIDQATRGSLTEADGQVILARCLIISGKIRQARDLYEKALLVQSKLLGEWNCDLATAYEGLAACHIYEKDPRGAQPLYKKVAQFDYLKYGPDDVHLGWSLLSLSSVERTLGNDKLTTDLLRKAFWNFRHQNEERILAETKPMPAEQDGLIEELQRQLYGFAGGYSDRNLALDYITAGIPNSILASPTRRPRNFDNWFKSRVGREVAPGLAFFDPRQKLKALIVTVHGLGLHHGAYTPFAEHIQHKGLGVVSFDVRGFGSYRNDEVYQHVNFDAVMSDLHNILSALRRDYPGLPIFILGESMGGAIALRVAAMYPELVDGCISSVPAGTRYQGKSTSLEVAVKLLRSSRRQFDAGQKVVSQATQKSDLRIAWEDDPQARMKYSPLDLLKFQRFMNDNMKYVEQIEKTPIIIFQGYSDQLVKPLGTLALYQAIGCRDKDLVFVGHAEHLIFEEGQFDQDIVDGLVSWIDRHGTKSTNTDFGSR